MQLESVNLINDCRRCLIDYGEIFVKFVLKCFILFGSFRLLISFRVIQRNIEFYLKFPCARWICAHASDVRKVEKEEDKQQICTIVTRTSCTNLSEILLFYAYIYVYSLKSEWHRHHNNQSIFFSCPREQFLVSLDAKKSNRTKKPKQFFYYQSKITENVLFSRLLWSLYSFIKWLLSVISRCGELWLFFIYSFSISFAFSTAVQTHHNVSDSDRNHRRFNKKTRQIRKIEDCKTENRK